MNPQDFALLRGEWIGNGPFTLGSLAGTAFEYIRLENADIPDVYSYVRRSRIEIPNSPPNTHNETGYIRLKSIGLMLSRGTYMWRTEFWSHPFPNSGCMNLAA